MSSLTVSVVMPSYNHARFLREAIDSVLTQDYPLIDLLVMDGGSKDGTLAILESYGDRIQFVSRKDRGQSDAINQGLRRAKGDIVCWLNSDDTFTPDAIREVVKAFEAHPDVEFLYGQGWTTNEGGHIVDRAGVLAFNRWRLIHHRNFIQQPSCFFRRSLLETAGLVDESLHYIMDWELWVRFSAHNSLFLDKYLSSNRTYAENKTMSGKWKRWREIERMIHRYTQVRWPPALTFYLIETLTIELQDKPVSADQISGWQHIAQYLRQQPAISLVDRVKLLLFRLLLPFIQLSRRLFKFLTDRMLHYLTHSPEYSGHYDNGGIAPKFHFSVGNPNGQYRQASLKLTPLSHYVQTRLNAAPVRIQWSSSSGARGELLIDENGQEQEQIIPLESQNVNGFEHFTCYSSYQGTILDKQQRLIGFLDDIRAIN